MNPFDFERHVMSFFEKLGLEAVVKPGANDFGMDGYAKHPNGLIVVQSIVAAVVEVIITRDRIIYY